MVVPPNIGLNYHLEDLKCGLLHLYDAGNTNSINSITFTIRPIQYNVTLFFPCNGGLELKAIKGPNLILNDRISFQEIKFGKKEF